MFKICDGSGTYPEAGGMVRVDLPAAPTDPAALDAKVLKLMPAGPTEPPMTHVMPAALVHVGVEGPGDGQGQWFAMLQCDPPPAPPEGMQEPPGEHRAYVWAGW